MFRNPRDQWRIVIQEQSRQIEWNDVCFWMYDRLNRKRFYKSTHNSCCPSDLHSAQEENWEHKVGVVYWCKKFIFSLWSSEKWKARRTSSHPALLCNSQHSDINYDRFLSRMYLSIFSKSSGTSTPWASCSTFITCTLEIIRNVTENLVNTQSIGSDKNVGLRKVIPVSH